jgi:hypothetical protein
VNAQSRNKIKAAGFRIFRQRRVYPIGGGKVKNEIWELSDMGWRKYSDEPSKSAMLMAWHELMKDSKNIGEGEGEDIKKTEEDAALDGVCHRCYHSAAAYPFPGKPSGERPCCFCTRNPDGEKWLAEARERHPGWFEDGKTNPYTGQWYDGSPAIKCPMDCYHSYDMLMQIKKWHSKKTDPRYDQVRNVLIGLVGTEDPNEMHAMLAIFKTPSDMIRAESKEPLIKAITVLLETAKDSAPVSKAEKEDSHA